jgi:hypothetical protein
MALRAALDQRPYLRVAPESAFPSLCNMVRLFPTAGSAQRVDGGWRVSVAFRLVAHSTSGHPGATLTAYQNCRPGPCRATMSIAARC